MNVDVRVARPGDEGQVLRMIRALATYEREPDAVKATVESLRAALFGPEAGAHALIAELDGRSVGLALWFPNFSTWTGTRGIYLEDLFVDEAARGLGVGRALFQALAREAARRGFQRIDWAVLDWNVDAMDFYTRIGGRPTSGWQPWRLDAAGIAQLAAEG